MIGYTIFTLEDDWQYKLKHTSCGNEDYHDFISPGKEHLVNAIGDVNKVVWREFYDKNGRCYAEKRTEYYNDALDKYKQ